jgi:hypothetical protein
MPGSGKNHPALAAISKGLTEVKAIMEASSKGFTLQSVSSIGSTCNSLLETIRNR